MSILLEPGGPLVIGHRGCAAVLPENTLPAFAHALTLGVDAIECDVRVTRDGVAVVHHDPTTARTCDASLDISASRISELRALNAAARFGHGCGSIAETPIPLLDEFLEMTGTLPIIIECKTDASAPVVVQALRRHDAVRRTIIGSFDHQAVSAARVGQVASGASRREMFAMFARAKLGLLPRSAAFRAMCIPQRAYGLTLPVPDLAAWGRTLAAPISVHVWTVNSVDEARALWRAGVSGVLTDDPGSLIGARDLIRSH
jgi:glycerophosphoryl diester phosphodiesterase